VESAELPPAAFDFWPLFVQGLGQNWLWLCLLLAVALAFIFRDWLLKQPAGRLWPVGAALLPPLIPFARNWDQHAPAPFKGCIVPILLLAVALLQLYGQERNNNDRDKQAARINGIATAVDSIGSDIRRLADAITDFASEAEEETGEGG